MHQSAEELNTKCHGLGTSILSFARDRAGLLFTRKVDSSQGALASYQFLAGLGIGMCNQLSFIVI